MADFLQHLINGLSAGTIYALVALGYTMVYGVLKLINFAHGDVMMVGVYLGFATANQLGARQTSLPGILAVFGISMAGCALLGLLIERLAYRPLREKPKLTALITAIGISFALAYGFQLEIFPFPGASTRAFPEIIHSKPWLSFFGRRGGALELADHLPGHCLGPDGRAAVPGLPHPLWTGHAGGLL